MTPETKACQQIDQKLEQAAGYYRRFGFEVVPDNPLLLFLSSNVAE